ncbi:probable RNA helicase SDE3 [Cucurbita pepo subsp. pepo]|uniref:probable RNA helicase SDE3 n=1 Tax=Cucurbita pepo subsp. pepo TaxID=3664 RepID=UPI000C9D3723|nr:probable RNA helicase SDE3 [Cucurbita pepo subsp. pepo]
MWMIINFLRRIFGIDRPEYDNRGKARQLRVFASSYTGSKSEFDKGGYSRRFHPSRYQLSQSVISIKIRPQFGRPLRDLSKKPKSLFESLVTTHSVRPSASIKNSESARVSRASEPYSEFIAKTYATAQSTSNKKSVSDSHSRASISSSNFFVTTHTTGKSASPKPAVPLPEVTAEPPPTSNPTLRPVSGHGRNQSAYILEANSSLALYLIPKDVEELIKYDAVPPVLRHPVCPATYKSYFAALLYAEDFYCKKWSDYKLESVNLELQEILIRKQANRKARIDGDEKFYKTFAAFEFDSVPERRPFLLSRDLVHARLSGTEYEPFQGFVYRVSSSHRSRKRSVLLVDFGDDFYDWHHETNKYDISFTFNRVCLKRAHQAIQEASDSLFHNFLFPESMSRTRHPSIQVTHSTHQCLDPAQKHAVHHILNLHSSPPYLINGPPCIHVNDRARNRTFELSRTGTIIKEAVIQIYSTSPNCRILICAPKNSTCDELMISLKKVIPESNMFRAIAAFRERDDVPYDILSSCYYNEDEECFSSPILDKLREYKIIFSTYMSSFRLHAKGLAAGHFNHIFLLDASAAIEPETLVPLTKFATNATSVIVTGQTGNQPNYVRSTIGRRNGLKTSYFERLEVSLPYSDLNPLFISGLEEQPGSNGEVVGLTGTYMY